MRILSVDCSTKSFAYGVINDGTLEEYGEIYFVGTELHKRLADARRKIEAIIPDLSAKEIDLIVFEDVVTVRSVKTAAAMAKMFGVVISILLDLDNAKLVLVKPLEWQNAVGVKSPRGEAKAEILKGHSELKTKSQIDKFIREYRKNKIMEYVEEQTGVVTDSDNISDAIAIGLFSWNILKAGSDF